MEFKEITVNYEGEVVGIIFELKSYPVDPVYPVKCRGRDRYGLEEKI